MAVATTLAGPVRSGLDGTPSIRGVALHPPWKGRDGLRAGYRVSCGCGCFAAISTSAPKRSATHQLRRAAIAAEQSDPCFRRDDGNQDLPSNNSRPISILRISLV